MTETTRTEDWFDAPELRRLRYFHGQLLGARDFRREQRYVRDKLMLQVRYLLGYGVVCGLLVEPVPAKPGCEPGAPEETTAQEAAAEAPEKQESAAAEAKPAAAEGTGPEHHRPRQAKIRVTGGLG